MFLAAGAFILASGLAIRSSQAFERYKNDNEDPGSNCSMCHGDFTDGTSPTGTVFPGNDKHEMHRNGAAMDSQCDLCHTSGDSRNPWLGSSNGTGNNIGVGCVGCHGRDYGGAIGDSGVGLRAHHVNAGITMCAGCHPTDPAPLPEDVKPRYYGTADTLADDPCNLPPTLLENWSIGDLVGLDNDGDLVYDGFDDDCCIADCVLPRDGNVDVTDLLRVLADWGTPGAGCDTDYSGDIDVTDLLKVLADWGSC
jgi:hypothetical protein